MVQNPAIGTAYSVAQARKYDKNRFTTPPGRQIHKIELSMIMPFAEQLPDGAEVLEVGCGTGRLLIELRDLPVQLTGVDASLAMIAEIVPKTRGRGGTIRTHVSEAAKLPMPDRSYDFVYAIRLLNQTESPEYALQVVREMLRVTRPGGVALFEFANSRRPRVGRNRQASTRLAPRQVLDAMSRRGAKAVSVQGAFLFGMGALERVPARLLGPMVAIDNSLAKLFPRWCARVYIAARRGDE